MAEQETRQAPATNDERAQRRLRRKALIDAGINPYPIKSNVDIRVPELVAYQSEAYARQYVEGVKRVYDAERAAVPGTTRLAEAVACHLFKLIAYKDEYEVARLHLKHDPAASLASEYPHGVRVYY